MVSSLVQGKLNLSKPSLDNASLAPIFQFSLQRKLTKKPPGRDPRRCPLMMSKIEPRRSATLVASSASRNLATVTRYRCRLSHYGFGHHKSENGIVSDSFIKVHPQPVGDDSISSRNVDVKTCRGELCSSHFAVANVLRTCVCARSLRFGLCYP